MRLVAGPWENMEGCAHDVRGKSAQGRSAQLCHTTVSVMSQQAQRATGRTKSTGTW